MADRIESATGEWDEDGFHFTVTTDENEHRFRVTDTDTARELMRAVAPLQEWVAEEATQRAAYDRASPEERARVLQGPVIVGETWDEAWREAADLARKAERENQ